MNASGRVCFVAVLACLAGVPGGVRGESYQPRVGERHPDLVLPTIQDGRPVALSSFRGKKVLLIQFASW